MQRRPLLALGFASLFSATAWAQAPVPALQGPWKLVAPFPPGGPVDMLARLLATGLQERHGAAAIVDNKPGAAGNLGIETVKRAAPDGKTLLVVPAGNLTINPTLLPNLPYQVQTDFAPVAMLAKAPNVLVANPALPARTVAELVALAQEVNAQLTKPATREALAAQGLVLWTLSPAQLDAHIRRETALWAAIIKNRKITAE